MRSRHALVATLALLSLTVAGVSAWFWHQENRAERVLVLAAGAKDSDGFAFAKTLAELVDERIPRLSLRVIETYGSQENMTLLSDDTAQLAILSADTRFAPGTRVADYLFAEAFHLIVREDSGIEGIADLKGKVVGLMPDGSTSRRLVWPLIHHYGLGEFDISPVSLLPENADDALAEGRVDAYFRVVALGNRHVEHMLDELPVRLLEIDQAAALELVMPSLEPGIIPKGTYDGGRPSPPRDLPVVAIRALLATTDATDHQHIYDIVELIHEARNDFIARDITASLIDPVADPLERGLPLHSGTLEFYQRDQPLFIVEYAETMGFLLSAGVLLFTGLWHLKIKGEQRVKNRADSYNTRVVELTERVQAAASLGELEGLRRELLAIFRRVFEDLDEDRISPAAINGFMLAWFVATQMIDDRRRHVKHAAADGERESMPEPIEPERRRA